MNHLSYLKRLQYSKRLQDIKRLIHCPSSIHCPSPIHNSRAWNKDGARRARRAPATSPQQKAQKTNCIIDTFKCAVLATPPAAKLAGCSLTLLTLNLQCKTWGAQTLSFLMLTA